MSYMSRELVAAVDIVYQYGGQSAELLSIAREQGRVLLDKSGISVAKGIAAGKAEEFQKTSIELRDGARWNQRCDWHSQVSMILNW
jgi:hypothetical protein